MTCKQECQSTAMSSHIIQSREKPTLLGRKWAIQKGSQGGVSNKEKKFTTVKEIRKTRAIADDCDILYLLIWQAIFYFSVSLSIHFA